MAFSREENVTKISIEDFEVRLFDPGPNNTNDPQSGEIDVQIGLSNSKVVTRVYDLLARLNDDPIGQAHLVNLISFRNYIRTRLENEVLPT